MGKKLFRAILSGDIVKIYNLLDRGADVNTRGESDSVPLHWAASTGQYEVAELLLDRGADVDAIDEHGVTPLMLALHNCHTKTGILLLDRGADLNARNETGYTPLHYAAEDGRVEIVALLLDRGGDVNAQEKKGRAPLHCAALAGHIKTAELLLDEGANVDARTEDRTRALELALELVRKLPKDANMNARADMGSTPLHFAVAEDHPEMMVLLLDRGADINARTGDSTPLMLTVVGPAVGLAFDRNIPEVNMTELLLDRGAERPVVQ